LCIERCRRVGRSTFGVGAASISVRRSARSVSWLTRTKSRMKPTHRQPEIFIAPGSPLRGWDLDPILTCGTTSRSATGTRVPMRESVATGFTAAAAARSNTCFIAELRRGRRSHTPRSEPFLHIAEYSAAVVAVLARLTLRPRLSAPSLRQRRLAKCRFRHWSAIVAAIPG